MRLVNSLAKATPVMVSALPAMSLKSMVTGVPLLSTSIVNISVKSSADTLAKL